MVMTVLIHPVQQRLFLLFCIFVDSCFVFSTPFLQQRKIFFFIFFYCFHRKRADSLFCQCFSLSVHFTQVGDHLIGSCIPCFLRIFAEITDNMDITFCVFCSEMVQSGFVVMKKRSYITFQEIQLF